MKILIANTAQFGYHSDTWYYSKYLSKKHEVNYVGWDYREPKKFFAGVNCINVSRSGSKIARLIRFVLEVNSQIKKTRPDVVFLKYFQLCFLLRVINPRVVFIFDVRTASILNNKYMRFMHDTILKFESMFFSNITIVSKSLSCRLRLPEDTVVVPVGSDVITTSVDINRSEDLNLVYVGTLHGRNIEKTVYGLSLFLKTNPTVSVRYKIIGKGFKFEEDLIRNAISDNELTPFVEFLGYKPHEELSEYFACSNVGVSFVPMTEYYDKQPVTKTYEYLLSGLPAIATATYEHKVIINGSNGVLIDDNPESFAIGLEECLSKLKNGQFLINPADYR